LNSRIREKSGSYAVDIPQGHDMPKIGVGLARRNKKLAACLARRQNGTRHRTHHAGFRNRQAAPRSLGKQENNFAVKVAYRLQDAAKPNKKAPLPLAEKGLRRGG
jgi:hypothetical protein